MHITLFIVFVVFLASAVALIGVARALDARWIAGEAESLQYGYVVRAFVDEQLGDDAKGTGRPPKKRRRCCRCSCRCLCCCCCRRKVPVAASPEVDLVYGGKAARLSCCGRLLSIASCGCCSCCLRGGSMLGASQAYLHMIHASLRRRFVSIDPTAEARELEGEGLAPPKAEQARLLKLRKASHTQLPTIHQGGSDAEDGGGGEGDEGEEGEAAMLMMMSSGGDDGDAIDAISGMGAGAGAGAGTIKLTPANSKAYRKRELIYAVQRRAAISITTPASHAGDPSLHYIGRPDDWVVLRAGGEVSVVHDEEFRDKYIAAALQHTFKEVRPPAKDGGVTTSAVSDASQLWHPPLPPTVPSTQRHLVRAQRQTREFEAQRYDLRRETGVAGSYLVQEMLDNDLDQLSCPRPHNKVV